MATVIVCGGIVAFLYTQKTNETQQTESKDVSKNNDANAPSPKETPKSEYLDIPELGVRIPTGELPQHLEYIIDTNNTDPGIIAVRLGTTETKSECRDGSLGILRKVGGTIPNGVAPYFTETDNGEKFEYLLKQYNGYYLQYIPAQNPCSLNNGDLFPDKSLSLKVATAINNISLP